MSEALARIVDRVEPGARLVGVRRLTGGVSADLQALELESPSGRRREIVVRRHREHDWKPSGDHVTAREYRLLGALHRRGLAVPRPLLLDDTAELLPSPYLVMERVEGTTEIDRSRTADALRQMAAFLARLHALPRDDEALANLPELEDPHEAAAEYLPDDELGRRVREHLEAALPQPSTNPTCVLHGDYWPGNLLWRGARLVAVIDWEDATVGDPLSDLAAARVELLCELGETAMAGFTAEYLQLARLDTARLPLWEVYVSAAALATMDGWGLGAAALDARRSLTRAFFERATEELLKSS